MKALRAAAFLDRDGTIIRDMNYISRPEDVELLPGVASAIKRLNEKKIPAIVITNQSGIGRGFFTPEDFRSVQARVEELLRQEGANSDGAFMCPHSPDSMGIWSCRCRKPGTELFLQASREFGIDPSRSWYVGNRWHDVEPAISLKGRGILIPSPETPVQEIAAARNAAAVAESLSKAVDIILGVPSGVPAARRKG